MMMPGARVGPYEIVALIGQGGMGEVYRAKDTTPIVDELPWSKGRIREHLLRERHTGFRSIFRDYRRLTRR